MYTVSTQHETLHSLLAVSVQDGIAGNSHLIPEMIYPPALNVGNTLGIVCLLLCCETLCFYLLFKHEQVVLYCSAVVGYCTIFPPFKGSLANSEDPDKSVLLSPSKTAFLLNALVSLECDPPKHRLLSGEGDRGGIPREIRMQVSNIKGKRLSMFIFPHVSLISRVV